MRTLTAVSMSVAFLVLLAGCRFFSTPAQLQPTTPPLPLPALHYPWKKASEQVNALANRIAAPKGFRRVGGEAGSFAEWLRFLPLKAGTPPVHLYNGKPKGNQRAHAAVIDIDVGSRDLQQCADAVMRLRGEYLFSRRRFAEIRFNFTNGTPARYSRWAAGYRPLVRGNNVRWIPSVGADSSYAGFRNYLNAVFSYAGTASLSQELSAAAVTEMRIGDVFIVGGSPGHAVIVVDMAVHEKTGEKLFLLAQSYMPAQEMHILKNPGDDTRSPWYTATFDEKLITPEWTFSKGDLKRFAP